MDARAGQYEHPEVGSRYGSSGWPSTIDTKRGCGQRAWPSMRMPKCRWGPVELAVLALDIRNWPVITATPVATAWLPPSPWQYVYCAPSSPGGPAESRAGGHQRRAVVFVALLGSTWVGAPPGRVVGAEPMT